MRRSTAQTKERHFVFATLVCLILCQAGPALSQKQFLRFQNLTLEHGLSQVSVNVIFQDRKGFIWLGTRDGLNRYDGYNVKVFRNNPEDAFSLSGNWIQAICEDREGRLWIGTAQGGLNRFDPRYEQFQRIEVKAEGREALNIKALHCDELNRIWVGSADNGLFQLELNGATQLWRHDEQNPASLSDDRIQAIVLDRGSEKQALWIATRNGLNRLELKGQDQKRIQRVSLPIEDLSAVQTMEHRVWAGGPQGLVRLDLMTEKVEIVIPTNMENSGNHVNALFKAPDNKLWIGTDGGLIILDPITRKQRVYKQSANTFSLSNNFISAFLGDRSGGIWVGTNGGGADLYHTDQAPFDLWLHNPTDPGSLSQNGISSVFKDRSDVLWVGTWEEGLNRLDPGSNDFTHYRHEPNNPDTLMSNKRIMAITESGDGEIWIGHDLGLDSYSKKSNRFSHYVHNPDNRDNIGKGNVFTILERQDGSIWVGLRENGLYRLDRDSGRFQAYVHEPGGSEGLNHNDVRHLYEDASSRLWIATFGGGLNLLEQGQFKHFVHDPNDPDSISSNQLFCLYQAPGDPVLWIGASGGGLIGFVPEKGNFFHFRERHGLPNDVVYGILGDSEGFLWMSTNKGIARFDPRKKTFRAYDVNDGLQSNEFNQRSCFADDSGYLYFGGVNGLNGFYPNKIKENPKPPTVVLTDFLLSNVSAPLKRFDQQSPIEQTIEYTRMLTIPYENPVFGFEFSALHFAAPNKNRYAYKLDGLDPNWIQTSANRRFANYTRVSPGRYVFRVKGANKDGVWKEREARLVVNVLPPLWQTWWAYAIYTVLFFLILTFFWRLRQSKLEEKRKLEQEIINASRERTMVEHLRQVDRLKDEFFANTSHELRTPLNGIIGLTESLVDGINGPLPEDTVDNLNLVIDSARRLSNLVNDILDFSRLKNRSLQLKCSSVDLRSLTDVVFSLSRPLLGKKKIELINAVGTEIPPVEADENRLRQIMHNLIGNAVKFTEVGYIKVSAEQIQNSLNIRVEDTGIGIPEEKQELVFDSFEQGDGSLARMHGGTGLGLAITRQLIALHGGEISVESTPGLGSAFVFKLPIAEGTPTVMAPPRRVLPKLIAAPVPLESLQKNESLLDPIPGNFRILIVDDEPINRKVLNHYLQPWGYPILEASSGPEALEILEQVGVDMILLDIMMPRMSGFEVCRRVREKQPVHELPIIFLTAKNQVADLAHGFAAGANDYITKPISKYELLSRVRTHLHILDTNRLLEQKVKERTQELETRNAEILRRQDQLIVQEKMASLGALTAGVAHEIKNPLNFVNNFAELSDAILVDLKASLLEPHLNLPSELREEVEETVDDLQKNLKIINEHGKRANQIVQGMMEIVSGETDLKRSTDLNALVEKFAKLAWHGMRAKNPGFNIRIHTKYDPEIGRLLVSPRSLSRVVVNLVNNALEAILERCKKGDAKFDAQVIIQTRRLEHGVEILIRDNGVGIASNKLDQIYYPFFTTKTGKGHVGLGLYISYDMIVREHAGAIKVLSKEGEWTECLVSFPIDLNG